MTSRHPGTIRGSGLGDGRSYDAIRRDYVVIGDGERERAAQPSPREIAARLHAEIAAKSPEHAALVAAFERRQAAKERQR
jgi:hypothetical protein